MAFRCDNCGKSREMGHRVSHAKNRTNHAFMPNIQRKRIVVDGKSVRLKLCTNCIKTLKKVKKARLASTSDGESKRVKAPQPESVPISA